MGPSRLSSPTIAAAVDVGTNSVLFTAARPTRDGLQVLEERCLVTRLGEGLGQEGRLSPAAMDRTVTTLRELGSAILALGAQARAAGTSALRRANNRRELVERAGEALGIPLEVLSGADEARLSYHGALSELPGLGPDDHPVVVDPGGGSTEVVSYPSRVVSLELGAVRLTERFLSHDPPTPGELAALSELVRHETAALEPAAGQPVVAVGGTSTTLAAISAGLPRYQAGRVHGATLPLAEIRALRERLANLSVASRARIPGLPPDRADIIVAGTLLLELLAERLGVGELIVSDRGLRYGLIEEIIYSNSRQE